MVSVVIKVVYPKHLMWLNDNFNIFTDSCHADKQCALEDKNRIFSDNTMGMDLYNLMNPYNAEITVEK